MSVAIVTGATYGIGRVVAERLIARGDRVVLVGRGAEAGQRAVVELGEQWATFVAGDVRDPATADVAVAAAIERFGGLDVLVNNAGIDLTGEVVETTVEDARNVMDVNFFGALWMLQAAARVMVPAGGGAIVNVASRTAIAGVPTMGVYGATKGALLSVTRTAAVELAAHGVRVNAVAPGLTRTPLIDSWIGQQDDPERFAAEVARTIPQQRFAEPHEVAGAILFLASDDATHITGATLSVDGGLTAA